MIIESNAIASKKEINFQRHERAHMAYGVRSLNSKLMNTQQHRLYAKYEPTITIIITCILCVFISVFFIVSTFYNFCIRLCVVEDLKQKKTKISYNKF